ncbi:MAG: DUF1427 family protein [Peptococcaceae bacterium]|nr:DUF1427 family protein [Peptococcaceae bacterium]
MKEVILSLGTGIIIGIIFALIRLPVPAPATWAGVAGVLGLFLGYLFATNIGLGGK